MPLSKKQVQILQRNVTKTNFHNFLNLQKKKRDRWKKFPQHIEYQLEIERAGISFAAGPFVDSKGNPPGPGMIIIRAKKMTQA